jgi:hypothetical protein
MVAGALKREVKKVTAFKIKSINYGNGSILSSKHGKDDILKA